MKRSKNLLIIGLCAALLIPAIARAKNVVIATSSITLANIPFWVGIEKKFFDEYGFSVQYVVMENTLLGSPFEGKIKTFDKLTDFSMAREVAQGK